jgi:AcrR family transcriptional regulator
MAKRAYAAEDKQRRRNAIIQAARHLFAAGDGDLPAVALVADAAGLAKGTVYLYFRTREAIFAEVLLEGWSEVLADLAVVFATGTNSSHQVAAFLAGFVAYLDRHSELLRLDALGAGVLERNLKPEALRRFKHTLVERLAAGGAVVDHALGLAPGRGLRLLMRTYALTRGLWQSIGADQNQDSILFQGDFKGELAEALAEYWRGALAAPDA